MEKFTIKIASNDEREEIYKLRYNIYAKELCQHSENKEEKLKDALDEINTYIIVKCDDEIAGFASITPPDGKYGLDNYIARDKYPFIYDNMYEGRLFTVVKKYRNSRVSLLLFFAIYKYVKFHGGDKIMTYGRTDLMEFYGKTGLVELDEVFESGQVKFKLMYGTMEDLQRGEKALGKLFKRSLKGCENLLPFSLEEDAVCYHGGRFFEKIGNQFDTLQKIDEIINADVLDAWFDPSPNAVAMISKHLPWTMKTSPPTQCGGLVKSIAKARGIAAGNILTGGGSSNLMYLAFPRILNENSRVLLINPTYGEYRFIFENVIGCKIDFFDLSPQNDFIVETKALSKKLVNKKYDMLVMVNPNNPAGQYLTKNQMSELLSAIPDTICVWIDETYIEYVNSAHSMEQIATQRDNIFICKSMSKAYALSGLRCAYLVGNKKIIEDLRRFSPPWAVSLPAQIAAVYALDDTEYYKTCYTKTHEYKDAFIKELTKQGIFTNIIRGHINSVLCELKSDIPAKDFVKHCEDEGLFIRDVSNMGVNDALLNWVRIAIKSEQQNAEILEIISRAISKC